MTAFPDVVQYQIAYDGQAISVLLAARPGSPADLPGRVRAALARALREAGAAPPPITVVQVRSVPREPGPAGKYKLIKNDAGPPRGCA